MFAVCVFPVYSWTNLWFLHKLPSWILFLTLSDILGVFAYVQAFALLESAAAFLFLVLIWIALPARVLGDSFVAQGSMLRLINVFWILVLHSVGGDIPAWDHAKALLLLVLYLTSIGTSLTLVRRSSRVVGLLELLDERLVVMLYVYVPLGVLGLILVVARNILGMG